MVVRIAGRCATLCAITSRHLVLMEARRPAKEVGLLSLPDELLVKVAVRTRYVQKNGHSDMQSWPFAASTCKRLSKLQLSPMLDLDKWNSEAPQTCSVLPLPSDNV